MVMGAVLSGLQKKLNLHGFKGKNDTAVVGSTEDTGMEQGSYIAMNGLDITMNPAGSLAN